MGSLLMLPKVANPDLYTRDLQFQVISFFLVFRSMKVKEFFTHQSTDSLTQQVSIYILDQCECLTRNVITCESDVILPNFSTR